MCFYYILHSLRSQKSKDTNGQKNTRTFLIGSVLYIILFMVLMHLSLGKNKLFHIFRAGLIMLFIVDAAVMFYIYKSYYGRSITNEFFDDKEHKYNKETDKYERKTEADKDIDKELDQIKKDYHQIEIDKMKKLIEEKKKEINYIQELNEANKIEDEISKLDLEETEFNNELSSFQGSDQPEDTSASAYESSLGTLIEESSSDSESYESDSSENFATENDDTTYNGNSLETKEENKTSKEIQLSIENKNSSSKENIDKKSSTSSRKSSIENMPYDKSDELSVPID